MTREQFIKAHGNARIKDVAGILHNYLIGETMDKHYELENQIIIHGHERVKDSINYLDSLLEFSSN